MRYTIRKTDTGWELVTSDGSVVAAFADGENEEGAYYQAVAHLGTLVAADRVRVLAATDEAPVDGEPAVDDGLLPETWTSAGTPGDGIAFCESLPGGRDFTDCDFTWRDPETGLVPLLLQTENEGGHWGAELAGFVEAFTGGGNAKVGASGRFYNNEAGIAFRDMLKNDVRPFFGVSVDPSEAIEIVFECTEFDEYGWCMAGLDKFMSYEIAGLTGVAFPGFAQAAIMLADAGAPAAAAASADTDGGQATAAAEKRPVRASASASRVHPPREWFELEEPKLGVPFLGTLGDEFLVEQGDGSIACPLQIGPPGHEDLVFGHIARNGQCHVGDYWGPGVCASPPTSEMGYSPFHVGHVVCADGSDIATGALTVGCEHAEGSNVWKVQDHYANAGSGWADVRVIDGEYGPWCCGVLRPDVTDAQLRVLRSLSLSGDWVEVGGNLELVGCLAVNTPGFPIARESIKASGLKVPSVTLKASAKNGRPTKLVAAGMVSRCPECMKRRAEAAAAQGGARDPRIDSVLEMLSRVERRTRHLIPAEAAAARARLSR